MKHVITTFLLLFTGFTVYGQMWNGQDTLYGNEWIRFDQQYYKLMVAEDGIYRLSYEQMQTAGIPVAEIRGQQFQLFLRGEEQAIYVSREEALQSGDYLEFYGRKNRSELDHYLYADPDTNLLNPEYSLISDTAAYFLTWADPGTATRRISNVQTNNTPAGEAEPWFWSESLQYFSKQMTKRYLSASGVDIFYSNFDGDGFTTGYGTEHQLSLPLPQLLATGPESKFELRFISNDNTAGHQLAVRVAGQTALSEEFRGAQVKKLSQNLPSATLGESLAVEITGSNGTNDRYAVAFAKLRYPRAFVFENEPVIRMELPDKPGNRLLQLPGFSTAGELILYDLDRSERYRIGAQGDTPEATLPPRSGARQLVLSSQVRQLSSTDIREVVFQDLSGADAEYLIISNRLLFNDGQGNNWVQAYADYRQSAEGGGFATLLLEVQQIYDQFGYGVNRHPQSIRNLGHYIKKKSSRARYALLIGKAREYHQIRSRAQLMNQSNLNFHVPTFGSPGSDNLLFAGMGSNIPVLSVGRIAASSPQDLKVYLDKVKGYEANARSGTATSRLWRKNLLHLGGGGSVSEQSVIKSALSNMAKVLIENKYGADVFSFYKTSPDPIQQSQSEIITDYINKGAGIMTFFGHSGTGGFDFSLDDPATYENVDRYPVMFSLGCLSGAIHESNKNVGENFVFQNKSGAMAFMATVGYGYISALNSFNTEYYKLLGAEYYGKGIGEVLRATIKKFDNQSWFGVTTLLQQFTLNGDPALVITPFDAPDYIVEASEVQFLPKVITAQQDSFSLSFTLTNAGSNVADSLWIEIGRFLPDGTESVAGRLRVASPAFRSQITARLPVLGKRAIGFNRFTIRVDADSEVAELPAPSAEQNNDLITADGQTGIQLYIFANGIQPTYPPEFSIVNTPEVRLSASIADAFAPEEDFVIELDTSGRFNSPFLLRQTIRQSGGVLQWSPDVNWRENTVYYWRVSPDSTEQFGYLWEESSFVYLPDHAEGWNQSHPDQLRKDVLNNLELPEENNKLKFLDDLKFVQVTNGVYPDVFPNVVINSDPYGYLPWDDPIRGGLYIYTLDSITADPWINNPPGDYGSHVSPWAYWAAYPFWTRTAEQRELAIKFLRDIIPSGNYVLILSIQWKNHNKGLYLPEEWAADSLTLGTNLFQVLEAQGAGLIRSTATTGSRPYVLLYKKDDPNFPVFEQLAELDESIEQTFPIPGRWDSGHIRSTWIGPSRSWQNLKWKLSEVEQQDEVGLDVYGIRSDSTRALLLEDLQEESADLSFVSAAEFPYLQLQYHAADTSRRTTPHLEYWRVSYTCLPEAALNPVEWQHFQADTLQQGNWMELGLAVRNISPHDMDSLLVRYTVTDASNASTQWHRRYRPLPAEDSLHISFQMSTATLQTGRHQVSVEVNPAEDQPELFHYNNFGLREFFVNGDQKNPVLDVTFDGVRIINEDIVSASPMILITLKDENRYLALEDTSVFRLFLQYPNEIDPRPIPLSSAVVRFTPAQLDAQGRRNEARLELNPDFIEDGVYTLIVQGRDVSNNVAGKLDYKVSFKVITQSSLSNVLNYPNPFSTSTRFVYTMTGSEPPADFMIRIMTVSGRIVRELTQAELGPLRIGTHQTDGSWDGTDSYGDRLANGVYLYQVLARDAQGKAYDRYDNGTDRFFEKNIGKLVLLR